MEYYPDLTKKTAVLASRLIRNHPLPDGNKRVGHLCALEFVARNGGTWTHPSHDPDGDQTVAMIEGWLPETSTKIGWRAGSQTGWRDPDSRASGKPVVETSSSFTAERTKAEQFGGSSLVRGLP